MAAGWRTSGWSSATATKETPKTVSGRVVKTVTGATSGTVDVNVSSKPRVRPIQWRCISSTFAGHLSVSSPSSSR